MSNCHDVVFCIFFVIMISTVVQVSPQALQTGNGIGLPDFINYRGIANDNRLPIHTQGIIYTYSFNSCGNITEWGADLHQDRPGYSLDFQVWRPSPTVEDSTGIGCYSLVGNNRFTSISMIDGLAMVTPSPQDYIQFQPNDVLGFYVESASIRAPTDNPNGLVLQTSPSRFTSELMWLASIAPSVATSQSGSCPYSVGINGVINTPTRAAPVISIATTTFPCASQPSSSSHARVQPSLTPESIQSHRTIHPANILSPTSTHPVILSSMGAIAPHQTTTDVESNSMSTVSESAQSLWLLIGSVTAVLVVAVVLIVSLAVIFAICYQKRMNKKKEVDLSMRRQSVISDDEHYYDYVHTFGGRAPTSSCTYSNLKTHSIRGGGRDCHPTQTVETLERNEAYDMVSRRSMDIEASQNVAYHSALDIL